TPPICTDVGGVVLNAAVTTNGLYPIHDVCRLTREPTIRISSIDLGESTTFRTAASLSRFSDPHDWAALPKAALCLLGFAPPPGRTLKRHLERFGAGLDVTFFSALPKGSGLGASSILGATLIAALLRILGRDPHHARVIELASVLEQLMSTGGGWQDQAGGVLPGVKLLRTQPGAHQIPSAEAVPGHGVFAGEEAAARCLLYFTGQRRLAKNILRNVVGSYLDRVPTVRTAIERLKRGALDMRQAVESGSLDEVAAHLHDYWTLKQTLDPGASNAAIDALFRRLGKHLSGYSLLGAGGGGFALLIARDARSAKHISRELASKPHAPLARFYDFAVDPVGLRVATL
ncbi:MAG: bifunctional fucokinase/L-fucose-1-P-guanylyltransferase, partial [Phycisphaerales bacterium]